MREIAEGSGIAMVENWMSSSSVPPLTAVNINVSVWPAKEEGIVAPYKV
jgi:hypothetical protein